MLTGGIFLIKKLACAVYSLFDFYSVCSPTGNEVSVTCPKSIKFIVLLFSFFKATKKSLDRFTRLLPGRREFSGSLRVESESDSCPICLHEFPFPYQVMFNTDKEFLFYNI